jgi:hypothetical protein
MKLFLVLLFVLLVLQLLSASAQPVSDTAAGQDTTHTNAPDPIALLRQCEVDLEVATVHSLNNATEVETKQAQNEDLDSRLQKCEETLQNTRNNQCQEELKAENDKNHNCQEELKARKHQNDQCLRDFINNQIELAAKSVLLVTEQAQLENANKIIETLKHASQQAAPAETCIEVANLKEELANARRKVTDLENAQKQTADKVVKLTQELDKANQNITQLADKVVTLTQELDKARKIITELQKAQPMFPDITIDTIIFCFMVVNTVVMFNELQRRCNFTRRSYTKNDSVLHHVFHCWKAKDLNLIRKYSAFLYEKTNRQVLDQYFREWKWKSQKQPRVLQCTTGNFQDLIETLRAECLQRARQLNDVLQNVWAHYKIEGTLPQIKPTDMKIFQNKMQQQIDHISKKIAWAHCQFNPAILDSVLHYLPWRGKVLCVQKWCKKFLGMEKFVKDFCHLLPLADAQAFIETQGLRKTGLQLIRTLTSATVDESSPIRPWLRKAVYSFQVPIVADFIFEELKKARDAREHRRNFYRNFWNFFEYCKLIVAVVLGLSIGICLALYEFYGVWCENDAPEFYGVCGVNDALKYS